MSKSIIQEEKECIVCRAKNNLHNHHVMFGTADRKKADMYGLTVWLCVEHHTGNKGVHNGNVQLDHYLKKLAQIKFEERYSHELWMQTFHRNWL